MSLTVELGEAKWNDFLSRTPESNPFQSPDMARVFDGTPGYRAHVTTVGSREQIQGLLASVLITYGGPRRLEKYATRALILGGPIGDKSTFAELLGSHDSFASRSALWSEIRNLKPPDDRTPFLESGYTWEDHQDFVLDLQKGEDRLWEGMSKSRRKGISHAEKHRLELVDLTPDAIGQAHDVLQKTYSRAKVPLAGRKLFENAVRILAPSEKLWACGAMDGGVLCSVRFVLKWDKVMFDWYAGSSDLGRERHADEWLVWQLLRRGVSQGLESFRFGGAGEPGKDYGPAEFKRRFGGQLVNPGRLLKVYHPASLRLAKAAYRAWRGFG